MSILSKIPQVFAGLSRQFFIDENPFFVAGSIEILDVCVKLRCPHLIGDRSF